MVEGDPIEKTDPCGRGMTDSFPLIAANTWLCVRQTAFALPVLPEVSIKTATPSGEHVATFL